LSIVVWLQIFLSFAFELMLTYSTSWSISSRQFR